MDNDHSTLVPEFDEARKGRVSDWRSGIVSRSGWKMARWFLCLAQDFQGVAQLFVSDGELHPPLEEPIIGNSAIAQYLQTEAAGMKLLLFLPRVLTYIKRA